MRGQSPPGRENRPAGNRAAVSGSANLKLGSTIPPAADLDTVNAPFASGADSRGSDTAPLRRRWAQSLIRKAPNPPRYGSPAWLALPEGSPGKIASVVVAAEAWALDDDDVEARLHRLLEDERRAFKQAEDADYQARAADHRKQWKHLSLAPPSRYTGQTVRPLEDIGADYTAELAERRADK